MKNALILHGTDFDKEQKQKKNNWFPWLKKELGKVGYKMVGDIILTPQQLKETLSVTIIRLMTALILLEYPIKSLKRTSVPL